MLLIFADEKVMEDVLTNENALNARIFQFPTSAIKQNGKKINYYDFLTSGEYKDCNAAINRIISRINLSKIADFIKTIPYISEQQKEFYKIYLQARFDLLLKPVYDIVSVVRSEQI